MSNDPATDAVLAKIKQKHGDRWLKYILWSISVEVDGISLMPSEYAKLLDWCMFHLELGVRTRMTNEANQPQWWMTDANPPLGG